MTVRQAEAEPLVLGIDISHYQISVDWTKVLAAGYQFAYFKATEGGDYVDPTFPTFWGGARRAGILRGAYHFFRPKTAVATQVDNFVRTVGSITSGDLPPALDIEDARLWKGIDKKKAVAMILEWLTAVEARLGIRPIIYLSPSFAREVLEVDNRLAAYPLWIAHYNVASPTIPAPWTRHVIWQTSENGTVDGVGGNSVDLDTFNGTRAQLDDMTKRVRALRTVRRRLWDMILSWFE